MAGARDILEQIKGVLQPHPQAAPEAPPYYLAAPGVPSQPPPGEQTSQQHPVPEGLYLISEDQATDALGNLYDYGETGPWMPTGNKLSQWQWELLFGGGTAVASDAGGGTVGGGGGGTVTDPALYRLQQQANLQATLGEEQRAAEMQPLQMANLAGETAYNEQEMERRQLSDQFTRAQESFNSAFLAEQLAAAKKENAVNALSQMVEYLIPPGMDYWPGMEPGGPVSQILGQAGYNYTAPPLTPVGTVDFSQFTQGLAPETDAALRYLQGLR